MKYIHIFSTILLVCSIAGASNSSLLDSKLVVTAQGRVVNGSPPFHLVSPNGLLSLRIIPNSGASDSPLNTIELSDGPSVIRQMRGIPGNGFLLSDSGTFVAIERPDTDSVPGRMTVYTHDDRSRLFEFRGIRNPGFSGDQHAIVVTHREGTAIIDLESFRIRQLQCYHSAVAGTPGIIIGLDGFDNRIDWWDHECLRFSKKLPFIPRDMAFNAADQTLWLLGCHDILRVDRDGNTMPVIHPRSGEEFVDLFANKTGMIIGIRRDLGESTQGILEVFGSDGSSARRTMGPIEQKRVMETAPQPDELIPWPFAPNAQHVVGNSYGAYQGFDPYNPYMHPGIDILVPYNEPVYAVRGGVVKAVLTTSGDLHWRVAVSDDDTSGTSAGYLYAHLVEGSITVNVGDHVSIGQHLGNIVQWVTDFHHLHFARIEAAGATWTGSWKNTRNPHLLLENRSESDPPIFQEALPGEPFAFCTNQTNNYQDHDSLQGEVDIIVSVFDRVLTHYESAVQELWFSIYPEGNPNEPVIDERLSVRFDMELDTYQSGSVSSFLVDLLYKQDSTCRTWFDYDARVFYHILTNSNGDEVYDASDLAESWNTSLIPDGHYVIEVTAFDANFNSSTATMTVTTNNGNPPVSTPTPTPSFDLGVRLEMPSYVRPGDDFQIRGYLDNPGDPIESVCVFFVLEVQDTFWFWPSWFNCPTHACRTADWDERPVATGTTEIIIVPWFVWPDTGMQSQQGLHFYGAMASPDLSDILGTMATVEWGYGP